MRSLCLCQLRVKILINGCCQSTRQRLLSPVRGEGSRLWDQQGKEYIDFAGGIAVNALGHAHPALCKALSEQAAKFWHTGNGYTNEPVLKLAKRLLDATFADRAFFCNSGAEANEAALEAGAQICTTPQARRRAVLWPSKMRSTVARCLPLAPGGSLQDFAPLPPEIRHAVYNDLASARELINDDTCAVIVEPIQGEGGVLPATTAFTGAARTV